MILTAASPPKHSHPIACAGTIFNTRAHEREQRVAKGQRKSREGEKNNPKQSATKQSAIICSAAKQSAAKQSATKAHRLDLHVAQSFYFDKSDRRIELSLDIINLGNLISRSWGLTHRTSNWTLSPVTVTELREVEGGYRPVYKFTGADYTVDDVMSRWHMQLGVKVVF